jgi:hypothetical protein
MIVLYRENAESRWKGFKKIYRVYKRRGRGRQTKPNTNWIYWNLKYKVGIAKITFLFLLMVRNFSGYEQEMYKRF